MPDDELFGPISLLAWGMLAIVVICVGIWLIYQFSKKTPYMTYFLAATLYLAVSMFSSRMHERYFFPAVVFLAASFVLSNNKVVLWIYTAISVLGFMTITEILLDLEVGQAMKQAGYNVTEYGKYLWVDETSYRLFIAQAMVTLTIIVFLYALSKDCFPQFFEEKWFRIWKIEDAVDKAGDDGNE